MGGRGGSLLSGLLALSAMGLAGCGLGTFTGTDSGVQIGPDGGRVVAADGQTAVHVPPGAVAGATQVTLSPTEGALLDGQSATGYQLGPEDLELRDPVRLVHTAGGDAGQAALLVKPGDPGAPRLLPGQRVIVSDGRHAVSAPVTAPTTVLAHPSPVEVSVSPPHQVVLVGETFRGTVHVNPTTALPGAAAPAWRWEGAAGDPLLTAAEHDGMPAPGELAGPVALPVVFTCVGAGRAMFGGLLGLALGDAEPIPVEWLPGAVDCVNQDDLDRQVAYLPEAEQPGLDVDEAGAGAQEVSDLPPIGIEATPLPSITARVGETFGAVATVRMRNVQRRHHWYVGDLQLRLAVGSGGQVLRPADPAQAATVRFERDDPVSRTVQFTCVRAGRQTYVAEWSFNGALWVPGTQPLGRNPSLTARAEGTADCVAPGGDAPAREVTVSRGGTVGDGEVFEVLPTAVTARVGEVFTARYRYHVPRSGGPYSADVRVSGVSRGGHVIIRRGREDAHWDPAFRTEPAEGSGELTFACLREGTERFGATFRVRLSVRTTPDDPNRTPSAGLASRNVRDDYITAWTSTATCVAAATQGGDDEVALRQPSGLPPGTPAAVALLEGGHSLGADAVAVSGAVGDEVEVHGHVAIADVEPGEYARVLLWPQPAPGDVLVGFDGSEPSILLVPGGEDASAEFTLGFACRGAGAQGYAVRALLQPERYDAGGRVVRSGDAFEEVVPLGVARCAAADETVPGAFGLDGFAGQADGDATLGPAMPREPCDGRALIDGYGTIDPAASAGVYTVPRSGSATYHGTIRAVPGEERTHNGGIVLLTPPLIPSVPIASWDEVTDEVHKSGRWDWEIGPAMPSNVRLAVSGVHNDTAGHCAATVQVRIDGGFTDSPIGPASAALTVLALGLLGWAGLPKS